MMNGVGEMKELPILFEKKEDCCGCTACMAVCIFSAIHMERDDEGFDYPKIESIKCVRCYMCLKVCPIK